MSIFAVMSLAPNPELGAKIVGVYPNDSLALSSSFWFVSDANVTPAQVSEKLGVRSATSGESGFTDVVVVRSQGYFGYASSAVWQWLALKGATA